MGERLSFVLEVTRDCLVIAFVMVLPAWIIGCVRAEPEPTTIPVHVVETVLPSSADDVLMASEVVEGVDCQNIERLGIAEYPWLNWLCSRTHFRNGFGTTVVGHDALSSSVREIERLLREYKAPPVVSTFDELEMKGFPTLCAVNDSPWYKSRQGICYAADAPKETP